jgi:hypothetical protein
MTAMRPTPPPKARPDARPLRLAIGMGAVAAASALITAFASPPGSGAVGAAQTTTSAPVPAPSVTHVTKYVQLAPGQTAPPQAVVQQAPALAPRVVVVTTHQSGKP